MKDEQVQPLVITVNAVAQLLGMSEPTFRNKRRELEARHNFPGKLPGIARYSRPAVERWIATNGQTHQPGKTGDIDAISAELEAEFGQGRAA